MDSIQPMKRAAGAISVFAVLLGFASAAASQTPDITDLILITGQSNVRASQTAYDASIDTPHPRVFAFTSAGAWEQADLHQAWDVNNWQPGNGSLNDPDSSPYNNFALHLGRAIVEQDPERVVGFVLASAPGRGIAYWDPDKPTELPGERNFYTIVMDKAEQALAAQTAKAKYDAVIWHQGETDWQFEGTSDPMATPAEKSEPLYYRRKLATLITNFRSTPLVDDNAIFICGETAQAPVNNRLMELNFDDDDNTACVPGSDLGTKDGTHFNAEGLREIGARYGNRYVEMTTSETFPAKQFKHNSWEQFGLPASAADQSVTAIFDGQFPLASYTENWIIYRYSPLENRYRPVSLDEQLQQGIGYWMLQSTGSDRTVHMPSHAVATPTGNSGGCLADEDCFEIPISGVQTPTWNLLSYPHSSPGVFGDTRLIMPQGPCAAGCSVSQANELSLIDARLWRYRSDQNQYEVITVADTWQPWSGFWIAAFAAVGQQDSALLAVKP